MNPPADPFSLARDLRDLAQRAEQLARSLEGGLASLAQPEQQHGVAMLTPNDLAKLLNVHPRTLRRMRADGRIPPPIDLCDLPRWRRADIDAWLAKEARS